MSFDTFYPKRKDHRKRYYRAKAFDRSCRNHGSCPYCLGNRTHKNKKHTTVNEEMKLWVF